jgi:hypothetical protein
MHYAVKKNFEIGLDLFVEQLVFTASNQEGIDYVTEMLKYNGHRITKNRKQQIEEATVAYLNELREINKDTIKMLTEKGYM